MITLQKNWKRWFTIGLTTVALAAMPVMDAYACGGGGLGGC